MNKADTENIDEQDLIERLKQGQQWAFNVMVDKYQEKLLRVAYGITLDREDSLEVVQDVFVSVFQNIHTFRQEASLSTWLRKITINQCLNWKRKWKRRFKWHHDSIESKKDSDLFDEKIKADNPEKQFLEKQFEENLMKMIKKLPEKIRIAFVLNTMEGLSYNEIATILNIKKGTVSSRIHWARKNLASSLEGNL